MRRVIRLGRSGCHLPKTQRLSTERSDLPEQLTKVSAQLRELTQLQREALKVQRMQLALSTLEQSYSGLGWDRKKILADILKAFLRGDGHPVVSDAAEGTWNPSSSIQHWDDDTVEDIVTTLHGMTGHKPCIRDDGQGPTIFWE